jgi:hypothetical protein
MKTTNFSFVKKALILYRFHDNSIYSDRLSANPQKFLDEFEIRKKYFKKIQNLKSNYKIEKYYTKRNLKILRTLLSKNAKTRHVLSELLISKYLTVFQKLKIIFFYFTSVIANKGIDKIKI